MCRQLLRAVGALAFVLGVTIAVGLPAAAGEWQTADQVRQVLIGTGAQLQGTSDQGDKWKEKYSGDGSISGFWNGQSYKGKWSFEGDLMCFDYEGTDDDGCWYLAISANKVVWWDKDGNLEEGEDKFIK